MSHFSQERPETQKFWELDLVARAFNPRGTLWVQDQTGLHSELQVTQSYIVIQCLKEKEPKKTFTSRLTSPFSRCFHDTLPKVSCCNCPSCSLQFLYLPFLTAGIVFSHHLILPQLDTLKSFLRHGTWHHPMVFSVLYYIQLHGFIFPWWHDHLFKPP